jgi:hypothetical protein
VPLDGETAAASEQPRRRGSAIAGALGAVLGVALFAWYVRGVGPAAIWDGLRSVGWGFAAIIGITGVRFALRAAALTFCVDPPYRVPFLSAFNAVLCGDALGNLTPLGLIASEPTKAAFLRPHAPMAPAVAAVAIETLLYTLTVAAMIAATTLALLATVNLPDPMRHAAMLAVAAIAAGLAFAAWLSRRRPAIVRRVLARLLPADSRLHATGAKLHDLERQIFTFTSRRRDALAPVLGCQAAFHALGVLEIYVTLWMILPAGAPLMTAFILEGANRLVQVVFKPVPLRAGVDEVTTGTFTQMLGYGPTLGATLAIVRKVRTVFWVLVGTALLVRRGIRNRP